MPDIEVLPEFLQALLGFLLQFATLIVGFVISALNLFLDFFKSVVGMAG